MRAEGLTVDSTGAMQKGGGHDQSAATACSGARPCAAPLCFAVHCRLTIILSEAELLHSRADDGAHRSAQRYQTAEDPQREHRRRSRSRSHYRLERPTATRRLATTTTRRHDDEGGCATSRLACEMRCASGDGGHVGCPCASVRPCVRVGAGRWSQRTDAHAMQAVKSAVTSAAREIAASRRSDDAAPLDGVIGLRARPHSASAVPLHGAKPTPPSLIATNEHRHRCML